MERPSGGNLHLIQEGKSKSCVGMTFTPSVSEGGSTLAATCWPVRGYFPSVLIPGLVERWASPTWVTTPAVLLGSITVRADCDPQYRVCGAFTALFLFKYGQVRHDSVRLLHLGMFVICGISQVSLD